MVNTIKRRPYNHVKGYLGTNEKNQYQHGNHTPKQRQEVHSNRTKLFKTINLVKFNYLKSLKTNCPIKKGQNKIKHTEFIIAINAILVAESQPNLLPV